MRGGRRRGGRSSKGWGRLGKSQTPSRGNQSKNSIGEVENNECASTEFSRDNYFAKDGETKNNIKKDKKDGQITAPNTANYHTYQSLDEAWKQTDEGFANLTSSDLDFLEKLYASQRESAMNVYIRNSGMKDKRTNDDYCFDEAASMECLAAASICPPPQQTLVDDWVDPGDENRSSVMQVVAARGSADEYLLREMKAKNACARGRTGNIFERSALETNIMQINQRDLVEQIDLNPDIVEGFRATNSFQKSTAFLKKKQQKVTDRRQSTRVQSTSSPQPRYKDSKTHARNNKDVSDEAEVGSSSAILGKRQRFYLDQWVEEDYLEKSKQTHLFTPMRHWGDLLNNYSDNHDGFYREWMQARIQPQKHHDDPAKRARNNQKPVVVLPPPAPSSVHHPAAWGLNSRVTLTPTKNRTTLFEKVHPACTSATIVPPPGHFVSEDVDDIDSLNIEHEFLRQQLQSQETKNFLALKEVKDVALRAKGLSGLEEKRESLQKSIYSLFKVSKNLRNRAHLDFNLHPLMPLGATALRKESGPSDNMSSERRRKGNSSSALASAAIPRVNTLAGCPKTHIPYGNALSNLQVGDLCDALLLISVTASVKRWTICVVRQLDYEMNAELRNVKVSRAGANITGDSEWIAVEDGRITPLHTHTDPFEHMSKIRDEEIQRLKRMKTSLDRLSSFGCNDAKLYGKREPITPPMTDGSSSQTMRENDIEQEILSMDEETSRD